ncbi:AraC family transcriptional regulator [Mameliella alba]|nr:AraC family transcriptional regulator [Mameliella alba]MBY6171018.1 AraC family transcriptional regulator [Mameliella alba]MBY6176242.1 AraC family transcriptional regulator [Mameliella alba]
MSEPISYEKLPEWVPGKVLLASDGLGWKNVALRSYHYEGQSVTVPGMRDFMLVGYRSGVTPMQRRYDGRWTRKTLGPGAASLLTRAQQVSWNWREPIDVTHVYLSGALVADVAGEMLDCASATVELQDVLRTDDPLMVQAMSQIEEEARTAGLGGALYVDSVARGLVVHLLRRYASIRRPAVGDGAGLTERQRRRILDFIDSHLDQALDLRGLGDALDMAPCQFARLFRRSFGVPPYAFVKAQRLERAQRLLATTALPIKAIAADCGFSDQAHLTRCFSATFGKTPAVFRRQAQ